MSHPSAFSSYLHLPFQYENNFQRKPFFVKTNIFSISHRPSFTIRHRCSGATTHTMEDGTTIKIHVFHVLKMRVYYYYFVIICQLEINTTSIATLTPSESSLKWPMRRTQANRMKEIEILVETLIYDIR